MTSERFSDEIHTGSQSYGSLRLESNSLRNASDFFRSAARVSKLRKDFVNRVLVDRREQHTCRLHRRLFQHFALLDGFPLFERVEDFAGLGAVVVADDPVFGHVVNQPGAAAVADSQGTL